MRATDRLARALVTSAARRWPADLRDELTREWHAELAHAPHKLAFAASLALSPAVEEADEEPVTWAQRGVSWAIPAALTLLAAALVNAVHLAQGRFGGVAGGVALVGAVAVMATVGCRATVRRVVLLGAAGYAFLLAGNQVAVMPFMGWIDVGPAVLAWTILMALTVRVSTRLRAAGRNGLAGVTAVAGGLIALDVAAAAGSLHAAAVLGVSAASAPAWFPLALLPGGVADFGAYFADGTATFGSLQQSGPAFHASDVLLGNASAMIGPLALCAVAVAAGLLRRGTSRLSATEWTRDAADKAAARPRDAAGKVALGVVAGLGGLAIGELLRRSGGSAELTLHRLVDNSAVFGFGFLAHPAGRLAVALLIGLLVAHLASTARRAT
ncbi:hypothetical protein [Actinoplanes sp. NPDC049599]|uniref:hypothetical protein n=1 Tax=Actinoplanes sp. NPDC049599 TaxID=3363903 RepID=UPI0037BB8BD3